MDERPIDVSAQPEPAGAGQAIELTLSPEELDLIRMALRHLEATLGREEADELEQVQHILARLGRARR